MPAPRDVGVDVRRVDRAAVAQHHALLPGEERDVRLPQTRAAVGAVVGQTRDDLAADDGLGDDIGDIARLDHLVEDTLRVDDHDRTASAESVTARRPDGHRTPEAAVLEFTLKGAHDAFPATRATAGVHAYAHGLVGLRTSTRPFTILLQRRDRGQPTRRQVERIGVSRHRTHHRHRRSVPAPPPPWRLSACRSTGSVSYTHLRAHETR